MKLTSVLSRGMWTINPVATAGEKTGRLKQRRVYDCVMEEPEETTTKKMEDKLFIELAFLCFTGNVHLRSRM